MSAEEEDAEETDEENAEEPASEPGDAYYEGLVEDLSEMGLPSAEFVFDNTESGTNDEFWGEAGDYGSFESLDVSDDDVAFSNANRFEVTIDPPSNWDVQYRTAEWASEPYRSVDAGDVALGVAYLRAPEGQGEVQFVVENTESGQWNSVVSDDLQTVTDEWGRYYFPIEFEEAADGDAYEWSAQFHFGFDVQTIDVGGIALLHFGQDVDTDELPSGPVNDIAGDSEDGTDDDGESTDESVDQDEEDDQSDADDQDDETDQSEADGQDDDSSGSDSVPGFGIGATIVGLGAVAGRLLTKSTRGTDDASK